MEGIIEFMLVTVPPLASLVAGKPILQPDSRATLQIARYEARGATLFVCRPRIVPIGTRHSLNRAADFDLIVDPHHARNPLATV
jgi:hypothetical protein